MKNNIVINYPAGPTLEITLPSESGEGLKAVTDLDLLEQVFAMFNNGSGQECEVFTTSRMRSMSVNDFVRVNGQWYQCKSVGWEKVTEAYMDEIEGEVVAHPYFKLHGEWSALNEVMWTRERKARELANPQNPS